MNTKSAIEGLNVPAVSAEDPANAGREEIDTRFGSISITKEKPIVFPHGLLGFPDMFHYVLTEFPSPKLRQFKLLQSLDNYKLSFITLPLELKNEIISQEDILQTCQDLEISTSSLGLLLVVSVHRKPSAVSLSVNARAPLFLDSQKRLAVQHVFQHDRYQVRHAISG